MISIRQAGGWSQLERWVLTSVDGAKAAALYHTEPRQLSADRCPPPTARWQQLVQDGEAVDTDMFVMAQWSDSDAVP